MKKIKLHSINIESVQEYEIEKENLYKLSPQLIQLDEIIRKLSNQSQEFFEAGSTNKCESFMNSRTKFVEKRFNITKQWEMRCQFSALNRELPEWKTILMEQFGLTINLPQIISQYKKNLEKEYEKRRQNTKEYKEGRFRRTLKKYTNIERILDEGHYLFKDELIDKDLNKTKFYCRYECVTSYQTKLSLLLHEIIFHKRLLLAHEQDIIAQNVLVTKKTLSNKIYFKLSFNKIKRKSFKDK
ncbi:hypothetical protein M0813_27371 [Anaeramoeba flamelloides]|uniref:C2H2-type domain-containing protein n=1 Tax=Anaeramoeba flamelloides TaxID=1746091 RepID=A0ABQ8XXE5_9EUKA|nr:hypothetical protein M0813_27371 [Anaeramoeba flamelloides]